MKNIDDIGKAGQLSVSPEAAENIGSEADRIEKELRKSIYKPKKPVALDRLTAIVGGLMGDVKQGWDRDRILIGLKNAKKSLDDRIIQAEDSGMSLENRYKMLHDEDKVASLRAQLENDLQDVSTKDAKAAIGRFDEYLAMKQREIKKVVIRDQQRKKLTKIKEIVNKHGLAIERKTEGTDEYKTDLAEEIRALDLGEDQEKLLAEALKEEADLAFLRRYINDLDEDKAKAQLKKIEGKLTPAQRATQERLISKISKTIDDRQIAVMNDESSEAMGQRKLYSTGKYRNTFLGKLFDKELSFMRSGIKKGNFGRVMSKAEYREFAMKECKGKGSEERAKCLKRADEAHEKWTNYYNKNKNLVLLSLMNEDQLKKIGGPRGLSAITGQYMLTDDERKQLTLKLLGAVKEGRPNFLNFRQRFSIDSGMSLEEVDRAFKEAYLATKLEGAKSLGPESEVLLNLMGTQIFSSGVVNLDYKGILSGSKSLVNKADQNRVIRTMPQEWSEFFNITKDLPGGSELRESIFLDARVWAEAQPLEGSEEDVRKQRTALMAKRIKQRIEEIKTNPHLIGDEGKYSRIKGAGQGASDFYVDNDAIRAADKGRENIMGVLGLVNNTDSAGKPAEGPGKILDTGLIHRSQLEWNFTRTFLRRDPKTGRIQFMGVVSDENGERMEHLRGHDGKILEASDVELATGGLTIFPAKSAASLSVKAKDADSISVEELQRHYTNSDGSIDYKKKREADIVAQLGSIFTKGTDGFKKIIPSDVKVKGILREGESLKDQIKSYRVIRARFKKEMEEELGMKISDRTADLFTIQHIVEEAKRSKKKGKLDTSFMGKLKTAGAIFTTPIKKFFDEKGKSKTVEMIENMIDPRTGKPNPAIFDDINEHEAKILPFMISLGIIDAEDIRLSPSAATIKAPSFRKKWAEQRRKIIQEGQTLKDKLRNRGYNLTGGRWNIDNIKGTY